MDVGRPKTAVTPARRFGPVALETRRWVESLDAGLLQPVAETLDVVFEQVAGRGATQIAWPSPLVNKISIMPRGMVSELETH